MGKMKPMKCLIVALVLLVLCPVGLTGLQAAPANPYAVAGIENAAEFEAVFASLQKAVAANDRSRVADLVLYPLREIMTPTVRKAIVEQKIANLFVNWQGVMVGNGEAWLSVSGKDPKRYGIIAVNLGIEK